MAACAAVAVGAGGASLAQAPMPLAPAKPKAQTPAPAKPKAQSRAAASAAKAPAAASAAKAPAPAPAPAAPAQPPATQANFDSGTVLALKPVQPEWTKVCGQNPADRTEICYTTRDFASEKGQQLLAVAVYEAKGAQAQRFVRFVVPHGLLVQPGLRVAVDQGEPVMGRYAICLPNGCFAESMIDEAFVEHLKAGTNLNVSVREQTGRTMTFATPLDSFAKGFDGPAIDPQVLQEQQKKVAEEMERRREEMRRRLAGQATPNADGEAAPTAANGSAQPASTSPATTAAVPAEPRRQVKASTLTEKDLIGANGDELGAIARVVENKDEKKHYVIVSRGGILGLFEHEYAIPLERIAFKKDQIVARDVTEKQLEAMAFTDGSKYRTLESSQAVDIIELL
jgi:invasion protein IalB